MRLGPVSSTLTRGYGTLAGLGIIGAALLAVPSTLLLDPAPPPEAYLSTVAGLVTGLACIALPWERMDPRWLHLVAVLATVEAAWAVAVFGRTYLAFFFLIAVAIAYVTPGTKSLLPHLTLIGAAIFGSVLYGPESPRSTLQVALIIYPLLVVTAGIFSYLRQRMVSDHRTYRLFAEETLSLANRIAGTPVSAPQTRQLAGDADLPAWSRLRVSARASAAAACILALPLIGSGLAVAGVKLPGFATDYFGSVGIELPNQDAASEADASSEAPSIARAEGLHPARDANHSPPEPAAVGDGRADLGGSPPEGSPDRGGAGSNSAEAPSDGPAGDDPTPPPGPVGSGGNDPDDAASPGDARPANQLEDVLGKTLTDVDDMLGGINPEDLEESNGDDAAGGGKDRGVAADRPSAERSADGLAGP